MVKKPKIAFFGTPDRAVIALDFLKRHGVVPTVIITQPDRPQGRKLVMTPPPAKIWAQENNVQIFQPENIDDLLKNTLRKEAFDFFVVVAYGKILKSDILNIPKYGSINLHASLLPRLRGSSPIETAILDDEKETGVSIIKMDELMDHGPIVLQEKVISPIWPLPADDLAKLLVEKGGELLIKSMDGIMSGEIKPTEQNHTAATFAKKISKTNGLMDLADIAVNPYKNFLKWNAYKGWPSSYFFINTKDGSKQIRVIITDATFENGAFVIKKVIPEGKKEMTWESFLAA